MNLRFDTSYLRSNLRHDALSSIVVFLVALPLCIGITIASGAPTGSGIVTGIIAGILETTPPNPEIRVDFMSLRHIDHACLNMLQNWQHQHEANHGKVMLNWDKLRGVTYASRQTLRQTSWWQKWLE